MQDYYKNLTCNDLNEVLNLNSLFICCRNNHIFNINLPEYQNKGVIKTTLNVKK
jgi:hypothetical protein